MFHCGRKFRPRFARKPLVRQADTLGAHTILINLEEPVNYSMFHETNLGHAEIILPKLIPENGFKFLTYFKGWH